ncbi:hypothetical protein [Saccharibacillus alkalitolerans]|uniref:Uncharacterized protein n=1 Tax=Saccharibacillus alkalitolerans TaxID=2705290 RepID=A0ABX0FAS3_9BACL|nr:hypothetical protein [Saccharibacillus alkalitolerans]NGZ77064.1 hypothetical protein [Saccharibacillus alkalitolerans]
MSYTEVLERKSEILKKTVEHWILKENRDGLNRQEAHIYRNMLKELHQNEQELNGVKNEEVIKRQEEPESAETAEASERRTAVGNV